jgi:hypothetical protein
MGLGGGRAVSGTHKALSQRSAHVSLMGKIAFQVLQTLSSLSKVTWGKPTEVLWSIVNAVIQPQRLG